MACTMREQQLQQRNQVYKQRADVKRCVNKLGGNLVLAHLRKERLPKGIYNKLKMNKIGPCKRIIMLEEPP